MRPAVVLNAGVTGITVLVQMLVMIARVRARARACHGAAAHKAEGCIWMPVVELCHFCTEVRRRKKKERQR